MAANTSTAACWPALAKAMPNGMRSEHGMLRASIRHVHRTELANYRRSDGTQAVLNQHRITLFLMWKMEYHQLRKGSFVTELHQRLNEWSL